MACISNGITLTSCFIYHRNAILYVIFKVIGQHKYWKEWILSETEKQLLQFLVSKTVYRQLYFHILITVKVIVHFWNNNVNFISGRKYV